MSLGPVQLLILGFDGTARQPEIAAELRRLRDHETVRLVDIVVVRKGGDGKLEVMHHSDLSEAEVEAAGALAAAVAGLTGVDEEAERTPGGGASAHVITNEEMWSVAEAIPPGTTAAVALLEHHWAVPLRDSVLRAGGVLIARAWVQPGQPLSP